MYEAAMGGSLASLFYSWQSDLPNNINRAFVRKAIDDAVSEINKDRQLSADEAVRIDQDTSGVPGSPDIVQTILHKIAACDVFVPDVSIVGTSESRFSPNPNVMIEYGYALGTIGSDKILPVVNTHYGPIERLPFNMRHRRSISYSLAPDSAKDVRAASRKELASKLKQGIQQVLATGSRKLSATEPAFERASSFDHGATFEEVNKDIPMWVDSEGDTTRRFPEGPKMFLRLIPKHSVLTLKAVDALEAVVSSNFYPLASEKYSGFARCKSAFGAGTIARHPRDSLYIGAIAQLLLNREIWGIETYYLTHAASRVRIDVDYPVIPSGAIKRLFEAALARYLRFAKDRLALQPPFDCVAGLVNVAGHRLALPGEEISTQIFDVAIMREMIVENPDERAAVLLRPFFEAVFDSVSVRLPEDWL